MSDFFNPCLNKIEMFLPNSAIEKYQKYHLFDTLSSQRWKLLFDNTQKVLSFVFLKGSLYTHFLLLLNNFN